MSSVSASLISYAFAKVSEISSEIITAIGAALRKAMLYDFAIQSKPSEFRVHAIVAFHFCNDIGHKMDEKIEMHLENDVGA